MSASDSKQNGQIERTVQIPKAFRELANPHRYKVYWGGRGGAKSWAFANALLLKGIQRPIRVLCTREIQKSIRESVYQLLADRININGMGEFYQCLNNEIRGANGTQFIFAGLWRNPDALKSVEGVDVCWVEEANTVSEDSWRKLIPSVRKSGSEIWVSFNPALKSDPAYQRFVLNPPPEAHVQKVSWRDNPFITQELIAEMEHLKNSDPDEYAHVYGGELKQFADGSIYAKQLQAARDENRITDVPIESVAVNTFWDLGRNDTTAIWFHQRVGLQDRFIDYYESRLVDLDHYVRVLKEKPYNYGEHYLPHDVDVTVLGSGNRSRRMILEDLGLKPIKVVPRIDNINNGIEQTRQVFARCWFDQTRCESGLDALANYQYQFDEKYDTFRPTPLHNWASNGADAFRQFAQGYKGTKERVTLNFASEWA